MVRKLSLKTERAWLQNQEISNYNLKPIGYLKSCFPDKFGVPRQSGVVPLTYSELVIDSEWQPELALQGLEGYSHLWLVFIFHLNKSARYHAKVHPPRLEGQTMGVFATRSPHRPNPMGLSLVEIVEVKKDRLILAGADLVDGTPILDIKPYLPEYESKPQARGGWSSDKALKSIQVDFTAEAKEQIQAWSQRLGRPELKDVVAALIQQDPRPVVYRGYESQESPYRNKHAMRLYDGDIHFEFTSANNACVIEIKF